MRFFPRLKGQKYFAPASFYVIGNDGNEDGAASRLPPLARKIVVPCPQ